MVMCKLLTGCGGATGGRNTLGKLQQVQVMKAGQNSTERTGMKELPPQLQKSGFDVFESTFR